MEKPNENDRKRGRLADQIMHSAKLLEDAWKKRDTDAYREARMRLAAQEHLLLDLDQEFRVRREIQLQVEAQLGAFPPPGPKRN